jgi:hypothetical protein
LGVRSLLRISIVSVVVVTALSWPTVSQADAVDPSATIGSTITCADGTGTADITLTAGSADTTIAVWGTHEFLDFGEDVDAGQTITTTVFLPNISDVVTVGIPDPDDDEELLANATVLATATLRARCDEVPYSTAGFSYSACDGSVGIYAQNTSTAFEDDGYGPPADPADVSGPDGLQPATFTISAESPDGTAVVLDTFVLDLSTPEQQREYSPEDLGDASRVLVAITGPVDNAAPDVVVVNPGGCSSGGTSGTVEPTPTSAALPETGY